jgi:hypothetical protein
MTITYVNDLRLSEMATGDNSGTWGNVTNTNLELIGDALGYGTEAITTNADTHSSTIADGTADAARAMYIKYTGTLDSACTITIGPNTISRVHIIENATSGSQDIIIKQGSGATVTIGNGRVKMVYLDGAGSGAAVTDALADLAVPDLFIDSDGGVINFGVDADVKITHDADDGLVFKSTATGDDNPFLLTLQTGETDIAADDVLGKIDFQAPDEGSGTDAVLVAASIQAISEGDFSSSSNATSLQLMTGASETATAKVTVSSGGNLTIETGDFFIKGDDGNNKVRTFTASNGVVLGLGENTGSADLIRLDARSTTPNVSYFNAGNVIIGHTSDISIEGGTQALQLTGTTSNDGISIARFNADFGPYLNFGRSGSGTIGTMTAVPINDEVGRIQWAVADGTDMASVGASISAFTEQLAASNDVPCRLVFSTTKDGESSPTEAIRIENNQNTVLRADAIIDKHLRLRTTDDQANQWYLYTNTDDGFEINYNGAGSAEFRIDTNGDVGIGTTSPSSDGGVTLEIYNDSTPTLKLNDGGDYQGYLQLRGNDLEVRGSNGAMEFYTGAANGASSTLALTIDSNQFVKTASRVGIGENNPDRILHLSGNVPIQRFTGNGANQAEYAWCEIEFENSDDSGSAFTVDASIVIRSSESNGNGGQMCFHTGVEGNSERMRVDETGNILFGCTSTSAPTMHFSPDSGGGQFNKVTDSTNSRNALIFGNPNGTVGTIATSGSATAYNTSSDYRLKENVVTDWDATSRLKQLKPSRFNFKADKDTTVDGFLAHEVSSIVPEAVTGTKDEVDENGNAVMQGIDQSKLVPLLVKTIQELEARIAKLEGA